MPVCIVDRYALRELAVADDVTAKIRSYLKQGLAVLHTRALLTQKYGNLACLLRLQSQALLSQPYPAAWRCVSTICHIYTCPRAGSVNKGSPAEDTREADSDHKRGQHVT